MKTPITDQDRKDYQARYRTNNKAALNKYSREWLKAKKGIEITNNGKKRLAELIEERTKFLNRTKLL